MSETVRRSGVRFTLALLGFVIAVALVGTSPASSHSGLLIAAPGPGDEVGGEIDRVQLYFGEPVDAVTVNVADPSGAQLSGDLTEPIEGLIEMALPRLAAEGEYIVSYSVSYSDGAEFESAFRFSYAAGRASPEWLEFESLPSSSNRLTQVAVGVLVVTTTLLFALLGWRFRRFQLARAGEADGGLPTER
ncbi:MAG: methionine-rich copper-binding protein CopC [Acidimicrobiales bacterium]|jgi:methionine-rich copper-binding protein CopC